jgi:hypothetical protein
VSIKQVVNVGEGSFLARHHRTVTSSKPQALLPAIHVNRSQAILFKPNHNPSKQITQDSISGSVINSLDNPEASVSLLCLIS